MWEINARRASVTARPNVATVQRQRDAGRWLGAGDPAPLTRLGDQTHKFRKTVAGFWLRATSVPISPRPTVTSRAAPTTATALESSNTKLSVISRVTTNHAARLPESTPNRAVARPIIRYS